MQDAINVPVELARHVDNCLDECAPKKLALSAASCHQRYTGCTVHTEKDWANLFFVLVQVYMNCTWFAFSLHFLHIIVFCWIVFTVLCNI